MSEPSSMETMLKNCEKEPINFINAIQEFGCILLIEQNSGLIRQVSQNVEKHLKIEVENLLGSPFENFVSEDSIEYWKKTLKNLTTDNYLLGQLKLASDQKRFTFQISKYHDLFLIELEPVEVFFDVERFTRLVSNFSDQIETADNFKDFGSSVVQAVAKCTEFDRIMIYQFDQSWNGKVVAENILNKAHSFMGHHFPASDIPEPARRVFLNIWVRTIPDVNYQPQPLIPDKIESLQGTTDLGKSVLRAVSPIHVEYLQNMKVGATLTISLKHNGKLWGLIACHHPTAKYVDAEVRTYCELIGKMTSAYIPTIFRKEKLRIEQIANEKLLDVQNQLDSSQYDLVESLSEVSSRLLDLMDSSGLVLIEGSGQVLFSTGIVPAADIIDQIYKSLDAKDPFELIHTCNNLTEHLKLKNASVQSAGFLSIRLNRQKHNQLIFFRKEHQFEMIWAGEPLKYPQSSKGAVDRLHPRISFQSWKSIILNQCKYWTDIETNMALRLIESLIYLELRFNYQTERKLRSEAHKILNQLEIEKKRAEESSLSKSMFLATMSHEIRTPIGAILGYIDLVKKRIPEDPTILKFLDTIDRNSNLLLNLIDDILDLSKVEAGKLIIENINFNFQELLLDTLSLMKLRAAEKGLEIRLIQTETVPKHVCADPTRFRQLIYNALSNALKFTLHGQVEVVFDYDVNQKLLSCQVSDTGIGISPQAAEKLFAPFQQAHSSTSRNFGGTGLGLVLSKKIAQAMGGDFWLDRSEVGVGSTFKFTISALPGNSLETKTKIDNKAQSPNGINVLSQVKVLVVDDSEDNLDLFTHYLNEWGMVFQTAKNGKEAIEQTEKNRFDIILMDIQMPLMDGYEAIGHLRKKGLKIPVVALTAHALKQEKEHCLSLGFSDYLSKPVSQSLILQKITEWVNEH